MNILEISLRTRGMPDKRYRIMVTLMRSDRPQVWNFICSNCGSKVCELNNSRVIDMTDFYDPQDLINSGNSRHCKGTLPNGLPCPYTYFFNLHV